MTPGKRECPGGETEAVKDLGGSVTTLPVKRHYPAKIRLSDDAENYLDALAVDLMAGNVELWQLSPALAQLHSFAFENGYLLGHAAGAAAVRQEFAHVEHEANLWYFVANNPGKRPGDYYTHQTNELWREASL